MTTDRTLVVCKKCGRGYPLADLAGGLCASCAPRLRCNAADKCGFDDCVHAEAHYVERYADIDYCTGIVPCIRWQSRPGIGPKRSLCQCMEVEAR